MTDSLVQRYKMTQSVFCDGDKKLNYCFRKTGDWASAGKAAVVLFLHGAGERGDDNERQLVHGAGELTGYCERNNVKALLLFPQCPEGKQWVDTPWGNESHTLPEISESMDLVLKMLDKEMASPEIDHKRIYISGISMGGFGTWDALSRHPEKFAAAFPVCGGADRAMAERLKDIPILTYHGDRDFVVLTKRTRDIVDAIRKAGGEKITYIEVPNCAHGSWPVAFAKDANWQWLFEQTL